MKSYLFSFFVVAKITLLQAQAGFVSGYLVPGNSDTLKGEVKINPKKEHDYYNKVLFKDANGFQKNYKPGKVRAYGFAGNDFVTFDIDDEMLFYKRLAKGDINLYKLVFEGMKMNKVSYQSEYYISRNDTVKPEALRENKFKKELRSWMTDNTSFLDQYEEGKAFDEAKAAEVINQYNAWKAGQKKE